MKEISSAEMSMLQGGFAPLAPNPPFPGASSNLESIMRALMNAWPNPLLGNHLGYAD
jgi:hypothetical protein